MATIRIKFRAEFELEPISSGDRRRLGKLKAAVDYLNACGELGDGIAADRHHFADAVDAIVTLANVARRARAS